MGEFMSGVVRCQKPRTALSGPGPCVLERMRRKDGRSKRFWAEFGEPVKCNAPGIVVVGPKLVEVIQRENEK
jgi:hypothetical protein